MRELAEFASPEVGVVTAVGLAHFEKFGGEQQIVQAKGELVEALPASGFAVLAGDDPRVRGMAGRAKCRTLFVGEGPDNNVRATDIEAVPDRLGFRVDGQRFEVPVTGRHHLTAALSAIAVAREAGLPADLIAEGLRTFAPVAGRCRVERIGPWTVIDDTYNASPDSMRAACEVLRTWTGTGRKILVAGDMLELGKWTVASHVELGRTVAHAGIDCLLAYGDQAGHVVRGARTAGMDGHRLAECESFEALLTVLDCWLEPETVVLVKGSRGMRMERVIEWLRERETSLENAMEPTCSRSRETSGDQSGSRSRETSGDARPHSPNSHEFGYHEGPNSHEFGYERGAD
jgi:UDP-N-acetylmuramoyl-tripeptide--D-alanyl-D-alanine ligase